MNTYKADLDTSVKSYFNSDTPVNNSVTSPNNSNERGWQNTMGSGLGISSLPAATAPPQQQEHLGVKKGRFSVNQANLPAIRTSNIGFDPRNEPALGLTPTQALESSFVDARSTSMSRIASNDSMKGRKSRFEVQHTPTPLSAHPQVSISRTTSPPAPLPLHGILGNQSKLDPSSTLPHEGSTHQRNLSRESVNSCKISRFSIEKEDSNSSQQSTVESAVHPFEGVCAPECRKKGRFELTGGMAAGERLDSPQTTTHGTSSEHSTISSTLHSDQQLQHASSSLVYSHIEALLKQAEVQKAMLHELLLGMSSTSYGRSVPVSRGRSSSFDNRKTFNLNEHLNMSLESSKSPVQNEIAATMKHLQQLLLASSREKERLLKENDLLKKEVERLRKQQQLPPPISTAHNMPITSILKSPAPPTPSVSSKISKDNSDITNNANSITIVPSKIEEEPPINVDDNISNPEIK